MRPHGKRSELQALASPPLHFIRHPGSGRIGAGRHCLASPKSRILTWPPRVTMMLSGFRSRCTRPAACAAARPRGHLCGDLDGLRRGQRAAIHHAPQSVPGDSSVTFRQACMTPASPSC